MEMLQKSTKYGFPQNHKLHTDESMIVLFTCMMNDDLTNYKTLFDEHMAKKISKYDELVRVKVVKAKKQRSLKTAAEYKNMSRDNLGEMLKALGIPSKGPKPALLERLAEYEYYELES